jgi:acyl-CoA-dependent ceramide synthase
MSYYNPIQKNYTQGWDDMYFVATWITVITGLRVAVMDYMLKPIARYGGVHSKKSQIRFAEQGWLFCYYLVFSPLGMVGASFHAHTHFFSMS